MSAATLDRRDVLRELDRLEKKLASIRKQVAGEEEKEACATTFERAARRLPEGELRVEGTPEALVERAEADDSQPSTKNSQLP